MTTPRDDIAGLIDGWSCDERNRSADSCRNPCGCHCREITALQARVKELEATLREHHNWHLQAGSIGLPDGDGGWVEIDNSAEYGDSAMYERTEKLLAGAPPQELQPMPRGGMNTWWWEQAVLLRRKVRAAESRALRAEQERDEAYELAADICDDHRAFVCASAIRRLARS